MVAKNYPNFDISALWQLLITKHKDEIPNLAKLANICLLLPVSTTCCERGFSTLNRIKTKLSNRLKTETLDTLVCIDLEGPPIDSFDFAVALSGFQKPERTQNFLNIVYNMSHMTVSLFMYMYYLSLFMHACYLTLDL